MIQTAHVSFQFTNKKRRNVSEWSPRRYELSGAEDGLLSVWEVVHIYMNRDDAPVYKQ